MDETTRLYEHIVKSLREYESKMADKRAAREKTVPKRLELYLAKTGITKDALAKQLDVSRMQLFRWLQGINFPGEEMTEKMVKMGILDKIEE